MELFYNIPTYVYVILSLLILPIYLIVTKKLRILNKQELEKLKKERRGKKIKYQDKYPFEYSKKEKRWTLTISFILLLIVAAGIILALIDYSKYKFLLAGFTPFILFVWAVLIKMGNKISS